MKGRIPKGPVDEPLSELDDMGFEYADMSSDCYDAGRMPSAQKFRRRADLIRWAAQTIRFLTYERQAEPVRLGMCRICERRTDGVTICRYCDRMMEHLEGVLQHHRDRLAEKRDEADRRYGLHGSEFTRGKAAAYADALEAFPVKSADREQEPSHD